MQQMPAGFRTRRGSQCRNGYADGFLVPFKISFLFRNSVYILFTLVCLELRESC